MITLLQEQGHLLCCLSLRIAKSLPCAVESPELAIAKGQEKKLGVLGLGLEVHEPTASQISAVAVQSLSLKFAPQMRREVWWGGGAVGQELLLQRITTTLSAVEANHK